VTADDFRRIALSLPEAEESDHMVKLTAQQQALFVHAEPAVFVPVKGGWGRRGATSVFLESADETTVRSALITAWRNVAPKVLHAQLEDGD
jgi:hypothetical protein